MLSLITTATLAGVNMIHSSLLTYSVDYIKRTKDPSNIYDGFTEEEPITIDRVYITDTTHAQITDVDRIFTSITKLFIDRIHSTNIENIKFSVNDHIIYDEQIYKVITVHKTHLNSHIELDLEKLEDNG